MEIVYVLLVGAIAGWLAGVLMKGGGSGLLINIVLGILGSFVGRWLFTKLGVKINLGNDLLNILATSVIGAAVILFVAGLFSRRK